MQTATKWQNTGQTTMNDQQQPFEQVEPGETMSVENVDDSELSIRIETADGTRLDLELVPGQVIELTAGDSAAQLLLMRDADPSGLLVMKPDTP